MKMAMASLLAVLKDISPGYGEPAPARACAHDGQDMPLSPFGSKATAPAHVAIAPPLRHEVAVPAALARVLEYPYM